MTLCRRVERKTYFESFIIDEFEADALVRALDAAVGQLAEAGDAAAPLYAGAYLGFKTMFEAARRDGKVDMWLDYVTLFERAVEELEVGA